MAPLIVLIVVALAVFTAGAIGVNALRGWHTALRAGLAAMFIMTAITHFAFLRDDLIAMVPPALPRPDLLVTATGILELLGAAGLLSRRTALLAAGGLGLLLIGMLPANIYAALEGLTLSGDPVTPLIPRIALQLVFLAATVAVIWPYLRDHRAKQRVAATGTH